MINKFHYRVNNVHKKLRKSGKKWIVVSALTLSLLGLGGIASASTNVSLQPFHKPSENDIKISPYTGETGVKYGPRIISAGGGHINNYFKERDYSYTDEDGLDEGSPNHEYYGHIFYAGGTYRVPYRYYLKGDPFITTRFDRNLGIYHGWLEWSSLQNGSARTVMRVANPRGSIIVKYPHSAKAVINGKYKWVDTYVTIDHFHKYVPWRSDRSVVFSKNLGNGIMFNGFTSADVHYNFYQGSKPVNIKQGYLSFRRINGLSRYGHRRYPSQDASVNNELYTDKHKKDHTGESIKALDDNEYEYLYQSKGDPSEIREYWSNALNDFAVGGEYGTRQRNVKDRSVVISTSGSGFDIQDASGVGYFSFHPYTNIGAPKPHKPKRKRHRKPTPKIPTNPNSNPTPLSKTSTHHTLTHPNENFTYTINGVIPKRSAKNASRAGENTLHQGKSGNWYGHWSNYYNYDAYEDDHYNLTDNLPKDVRLRKSGLRSLFGVKPFVYMDGDHQVIAWDLNRSEMDRASQRNFTLKVPVTANHLPVPNKTGYHYFTNHADADEDIYGQSEDEKAQATNRIRVIGYHNHWYDFNGNGEIGQLIPESESETFGHNDSWKPYWYSKDTDLNKQIKNRSMWAKPYDDTNTDDYYQQDAGDGLAYRGSHLRIPLQQGFKKRVRGQDYDYQFGYGEDKQFADPVLNHNANNQSFFKPYIVPTFNQSPTDRMYIWTDKQENGLPFLYNMKSYDLQHVELHKDLQDARVVFKVTYAGNDNAGDNTQGGTVLDRQSMPLSQFINQHGKHGSAFHGFKGRLATWRIHNPFSQGDNVPVKVHVYLANNNRRVLLNSHVLKTAGYISSETNLDFDPYNADNGGVDDGDRDVFTAPQFTEKSYGTPMRTANEVAEVYQNHNQYKDKYVLHHQNQFTKAQIQEAKADNNAMATATTGEKLKSDLQVYYFGYHAGRLANDDNQATTMDYAFPDNYVYGNKQSNINFPTVDSNPEHLSNETSQLNNKVGYGTHHIGVSADNSFKDYFNLSRNHINFPNRRFMWRTNRKNREYQDGYPANLSKGDYMNATYEDRMQNNNTHYVPDREFHGKTLSQLSSAHPRLAKFFGKHPNLWKIVSNKVDANGNSGSNTVDAVEASNSKKRQILNEYHDINTMYDGDATLRAEHLTEPHYTYGLFTRSYNFFPKKLYRDSGDMKLATDSDPLASNKAFHNSNEDTVDGGKYAYTPDFMPLGYENMVFMKSQPSGENTENSRLGNNWFNITESRPVKFVGHYHLADLSKSEQFDDTSVQPVLNGDPHIHNDWYGSNIKNMSQADLKWLRDTGL